MAHKGAIHGRDNRDGGGDPISGPWVQVFNEGTTIDPNLDLELNVDYVFFDNGAEQPAAPYEQFAFRRGLSKLDTKGHIDVSGFTSGNVAFTIPAIYRLPNDQFFVTVLYDGADPIAAMIFLDASSGDVTITYPLV